MSRKKKVEDPSPKKNALEEAIRPLFFGSEEDRLCTGVQFFTYLAITPLMPSKRWRAKTREGRN